MKVRTLVEAEVEAEIGLDDVISALHELKNPERIHQAFNLLNTCIGLLRSMPDELVGELSDKQREIVVAAMREQEERYSFMPANDKLCCLSAAAACQPKRDSP